MGANPLVLYLRIRIICLVEKGRFGSRCAQAGPGGIFAIAFFGGLDILGDEILVTNKKKERGPFTPEKRPHESVGR